MLHLLNSRRRFRSSVRRSNVDRRRLFESLEPRQVMAGNVTAIVEPSGNLTITGDDALNGLYITQSAQGEFQIIGLDADGSATTINGSAELITLKNVTGSITIKTGAGFDVTQFEYFNHTGGLTIDAGDDHDLVNIGTSNRASVLTGDLAVNFLNALTLNIINTSIVGSATFEHKGPVALTPPSSYAITGCNVSENLSIDTNLQWIQVFIESTDVGGRLSIDNARTDTADPRQVSTRPSFVVLNNVSTKLGFTATLFTPVSFVINASNFDQIIDPLAQLPTPGASSVVIKMYGGQNILQITDTFIRDNLTVENTIFGQNDTTFDIEPILFQSVYDIIQINDLTVLGTTTLNSSGNVSVKNSEMGNLNVEAKNWVRIVNTTAADVSTNVATRSRSARTTIEDCEFANLSIDSNYDNRHAQLVGITDSKIAGIVEIGGRSVFVGSGDDPFELEQVFSTATASLTILNSEIGTLKYSYEQVNPLNPPGLKLLLKGGSGVDTIVIRDSKFAAISAKLGAGDDSIYFSNTSVTGNAYADGGLGFDVRSDEQLLGAASAFFEQFEDMYAVINFNV